jgi:putative nucleotide binding protein
MSDKDSDREEYVYVLDYMPTGRSEDRASDEPLAQALGVDGFTLLEILPKKDADVTIGDRLYVGDEERERVDRVKQRIEYTGLTQGAQMELEYAVKDIVDEDQERFLDFFNEAGSVTIRMHQLDLLPGVGEKIRNTVLDERKYDEFESYDDLEDRVSGFHDPAGVLVDRILQEIDGGDVKYKLFVR